MANAPLISVVMATYNGSGFLEAQLDSVYGQSYKNIEVIVCDDRSDDTTPEILEKFALSNGLKYTINPEKLGVVQNFAKAIGMASGSYIALCDQDDIWQPDKLKRSISMLQSLEAETPAGTPALVYTDLEVVDHDLNQICPSYWQYMQLNPANNQLNKILVENVVTGCTALFNRPLAKLALPIPPQALMHDVWLLMVASCFGQVGYLHDKTVRYRQHASNVVGAAQKDRLQKLSNFYHKIRSGTLRLLSSEIRQAEVFYNMYGNQLSSKDKETLEAFISLKSRNFLCRKWLIWKYSFFGSTYAKAANVLLRA